MARIPEAEIERLKATIDLAALVRSRGVELRQHGARDLVGRCPFHEEQTASFVVSPHKRLFHCLGCGAAGNVIQFVERFDGVSFGHAFELLACGADIRARLTRLGVVNPFAHLLTFTAGRTRTRRDHEKYLTLIDSIALLHQHQRTIITKEVNKRVVEFIEVQLADIETANTLAPEILGRSLDELPPQTRRLLNSIRELLKAKIEEAGQPQSRLLFSRREVCERSGWTYAQVRTHLERLIAVELVATRAGRNGAVMLYELLADAGAPETAWPIGLIDVGKLRSTHHYDADLAGKTAPLAPPCQSRPAKLEASDHNAPCATLRPCANAHLEPQPFTVVS